MQSIGVLICGYSQEDARIIKGFLDRSLDTYVLMVGASSATDRSVLDILRRGQAEHFQEEEIKILMFLGFSEVQTHMVLEGFPGDGGLKRPIFCALTKQNQHRPLRELIGRLVEEQRQWSGKEA